MNPFLSKLKNYLMRQLPMQRLAAYFGIIPQPDKWIFIIGCYNSGTTLLSKILSRHSQIQTLPGEGVAFTDSLTRPEEFGWPRLWFKCQHEMRVNTTNPAELANRIKKQWGCAATGKGSNFLEKSIANAARLEFLNDFFQPAYFIHIRRNGYAVAEGIQRKAHPGAWNNREFTDKYPIAYCAEQWKVTEELINAQSKRLDRYYPLSYESLVASPEAETQNILDFLDLSWEPRMIDGEVLVHGQRRPISNMNRPSFENLDSRMIEEIDQVASELLARYDYTTQEPV